MDESLNIVRHFFNTFNTNPDNDHWYPQVYHMARSLEKRHLSVDKIFILTWRTLRGGETWTSGWSGLGVGKATGRLRSISLLGFNSWNYWAIWDCIYPPCQKDRSQDHSHSTNNFFWHKCINILLKDRSGDGSHGATAGDELERLHGSNNMPHRL